MLSRKWRLLIAAALTLFVLIRWRHQARLLLRLLLGGAIIAFLISPACVFLSRRLKLNRSLSVLVSYLAILAVVACVFLVFLPPLIAQLRELFSSVPSLISNLRRSAGSFNEFLTEKGFRPLTMPELNWESLKSGLPILDGTATFAGSLVSAAGEFILMVTLAFYFIRDREKLALRLEMLVPSRCRGAVLKMAAAIRQEISLYIRCQLLISLIVAALSAFALLLCGVRAFLALGLIVGLFNLIPYFGPILGAIPALLMALPGGLRVVLPTLISLIIVQQIDGMIVSPRVMGAITGLHPALVLVAITLGSSLGGIAGMLFAVPILLILRSISRNWPVPYENV